MEAIFSVEHLNISLRDKGRLYPAVTDLSMQVQPGKTLGIVGESGSGKSLTCQAVLGLLNLRKWQVTGRLFINNQTIDLENPKGLTLLRGRELALILQNPAASFDPVYTIGHHFEETVFAHEPGSSRRAVRSRAVALLQKLHLQEAEQLYDCYPFQCSGGMLQRIMIALAVLGKPTVLLADEPTTALDRTIQQELLLLLKEIQQENGMAMILVSHDLRVMEQMAVDLAVMYGGIFVETGSAEQLHSEPVHPYTKALFGSRPRFSKDRLCEISGSPCSLKERVSGCPFYARCSRRTPDCMQPLDAYHCGNHVVRCKGELPDGFIGTE